MINLFCSFLVLKYIVNSFKYYSSWNPQAEQSPFRAMLLYYRLYRVSTDKVTQGDQLINPAQGHPLCTLHQAEGLYS